MSPSKRGAVATLSDTSDLRPSVIITDMDTVHEENDNDRYGRTKNSSGIFGNTATYQFKMSLEYFTHMNVDVRILITSDQKYTLSSSHLSEYSATSAKGKSYKKKSFC